MFLFCQSDVRVAMDISRKTFLALYLTSGGKKLRPLDLGLR